MAMAGYALLAERPLVFEQARVSVFTPPKLLLVAPQRWVLC
jgi:hypothetical protein